MVFEELSVIASEHFLATTKGLKGMSWCLFSGLNFEFGVMASDTDSADVTELTERNEDSGLSRVDKRKEIDVLLIQIKSRKRTAKTKVTKLRHELERLCVKDSEEMVIESVIEQLWTALENAQETLDELSAFYVEIGDESGKNETFDETETIEKEGQKTN